MKKLIILIFIAAVVITAATAQVTFNAYSVNVAMPNNNPVNDTWVFPTEPLSQIQIDNYNQKAKKDNNLIFIADRIFGIRLYDGQGNLLRQAITKGGMVQFNVSNFPNGIYYLHIYDGENSSPEIQQIMVER